MVRPDKCRKTGVMNLVIGVKGVVGDDVLDALVSRNVQGAAVILSLNFISFRGGDEETKFSDKSSSVRPSVG